MSTTLLQDMAYQQLFEVDMDVLINEVCIRPVLWDKSLEDYRSRTANAEAWKDVCLALMPDLQTSEPKERQKYCRFIMKKWVNVKDSWLRYNRKNNGNQKSVPGTKYSRKYVYNDALQFLKKNYSYFGEQDTSKSFPDKKPSQKTATNETTARECKSSVAEQVKTLNTEPKKRRRKRDAERSRLSEDRHLSFFRGILPSLTHLSEDEVLQFQVGVMSVLKGIKDAKRNPTMSYHSQHSAMPSLMWNALTPIPPNILGYPGNYIPQYHDVLSSSTSKDIAASHHSVYHPSNHGGANSTHVANTSCSGLDEDQIDLESTESSFIEESISSDSSTTLLVKLEKSVIVPQEK